MTIYVVWRIFGELQHEIAMVNWHSVVKSRIEEEKRRKNEQKRQHEDCRMIQICMVMV